MLESLLTSYGYPVVLAGTFLEGEAILLMAGVAAHIGYLSLGWVMVWGFVGSTLSNQLLFLLGRRRGRAMLAHRPAWQVRSERVLAKLERHETAWLFGFRFLYGVRFITPFAIGLIKISRVRFTLFNVIGGAIWSIAVSLAGYYFGKAVDAVFGDIQKYELRVMGGILAAALLFWLVRFWRGRSIRAGQAVGIGSRTSSS